MPGLIIAAVIVLPVVYYVSVYNDVKRLSLKVDETEGNIDIALAKRFSVLTQLFEIAKGYAKHEKETLMNITEIRRGMSISKKSDAYQQVEAGFQRINLLAESYPELKADQHFLKLQDAVVDTEEHLSAARRLYNSNVTQFNQRIQTFPGNVIASSMDAKTKSLLQFDPNHLKDVRLND